MSQKIPTLSILLMLVATTCIVGGDTAAKLLTGGGTHPVFVGWSRFAVGALLVVPFSRIGREELAALLDWRIVLRTGFIVSGITCILTALKTEPIANVFGAFFIGPAVSYILSALLLREAVTVLRSVLLAMGFAGVLMVVQPGAGMGVGMLWALAAGVFYGAYLVATRWLAPRFRPGFLLSAQLILGAIVLAPFGLWHLPQTASAGWGALVTISALASALGNLILVRVNRNTPASVTAPLIYFQLVAATVLGLLVFGDWPDPLAAAGLLVIVASGFAGFALAQRAAR